MNWMHYVLVGCGAIGAAATYVAQVDPNEAGLAHAVIAFCGALVAGFGLLSPKLGAQS